MALRSISRDVRMSGYWGDAVQRWSLHESTTLPLGTVAGECHAGWAHVPALPTDGRPAPALTGSNGSRGIFADCIGESQHIPGTDILPLDFVAANPITDDAIETGKIYLRSNLLDGLLFKANADKALPADLKTGDHSTRLPGCRCRSPYPVHNRAGQSHPVGDNIPTLMRAILSDCGVKACVRHEALIEGIANQIIRNRSRFGVLKYVNADELGDITTTVGKAQWQRVRADASVYWRAASYLNPITSTAMRLIISATRLSMLPSVTGIFGSPAPWPCETRAIRHDGRCATTSAPAACRLSRCGTRSRSAVSGDLDHAGHHGHERQSAGTENGRPVSAAGTHQGTGRGLPEDCGSRCRDFGRHATQWHSGISRGLSRPHRYRRWCGGSGCQRYGILERPEEDPAVCRRRQIRYRYLGVRNIVTAADRYTGKRRSLYAFRITARGHDAISDIQVVLQTIFLRNKT